jgi:hypothetical protein
MERARKEGRKRELVSCGSGVLQQRGACGMAGNAAERSEWRRANASTGWVRKDGSESSEEMGVNERASEQAREGAAYLFFISLNEESTILYGE